MQCDAMHYLAVARGGSRNGGRWCTRGFVEYPVRVEATETGAGRASIGGGLSGFVAAEIVEQDKMCHENWEHE